MARARPPKDPAITQSHLIALRVSLLFLMVGAIWGVATDLLLYYFAQDPFLAVKLDTARRWIFVLFAAVVMFVITDRSVRKLARSKATLEAVVQSISDGVFVIDRDGRIRKANPAAARILGLDDPDEMIGLNGSEFVRRYQVGLPDGRLLPSEDLVSQRALTGEQPPPYKAVLRPPGRPEVFAIVTGAPVRPIPEGAVALSVSVIHDVTAMEHIERMRDTIISSAAHTLKTPVAVINAQADLLADGTTSSWKASTDAIKRQAGRVARLTDNLLVLARIRSNTLDLRPRAVDLAGVIHDVSDDMQTAAIDHGIHAIVSAHPMVFADHDRLALVVRNLVEVANRRSLPRTDVDLVVEEIGMYGRVSVIYPPVGSFESFAEWDADAGFAGLGLERYVSSELLHASKGTLGSDDLADGRRQDWIAIPTMEEVAHA